MFNAITIEIPMTVIMEIENSTLNFTWKQKRLWIARQYWAKRGTLEESQYPSSNNTTETCCSKNSIVLIQKLKTVEQNKRPRYKSMQLCSITFWQSHQNHMMEKREPRQQMLLGKLDICLQRTETRSMSFTLCKYEFKVK
jgi:hypothetical protein